MNNPPPRIGRTHTPLSFALSPHTLPPACTTSTSHPLHHTTHTEKHPPRGGSARCAVQGMAAPPRLAARMAGAPRPLRRRGGPSGARTRAPTPPVVPPGTPSPAGARRSNRQPSEVTTENPNTEHRSAKKIVGANRGCGRAHEGMGSGRQTRQCARTATGGTGGNKRAKAATVAKGIACRQLDGPSLPHRPHTHLLQRNSVHRHAARVLHCRQSQRRQRRRWRREQVGYIPAPTQATTAASRSRRKGQAQAPRGRPRGRPRGTGS